MEIPSATIAYRDMLKLLLARLIAIPAVQDHTLPVLLNALIAMRENGPATLLTPYVHPAMLVSSPLHTQTAAPTALLELPIPYQVKPLAPIASRTATPMPILLD